MPPDAVVEVQDADARRSGSAGDDFPPDAIVDVHVLPILPTPPSRAAVMAFIAACSVVLAVACISYSLGGSTHALAVTGASASFPAGAMVALSRMQHGGSRLVAASPSHHPLLSFAVAAMLALLLDRFVTLLAWVVGCYLARVAWRCAVAAALGARRAVRCSPAKVRCAAYCLAFLAGQQLLNLGMRGTDAAPTAARVQRVRRAVEAVPMPTSFRQQLYHGCAARHNVAFVNMLGAESTAALACRPRR